MKSAVPSIFLEAILSSHSAHARLLAWESVKATFRHGTVWEGEVLVFELLDHPTARLCYAWEVDGVVTTALAEGPVKSARDAVRAANRASSS